MKVNVYGTCLFDEERNIVTKCLKVFPKQSGKLPPVVTIFCNYFVTMGGTKLKITPQSTRGNTEQLKM